MSLKVVVGTAMVTFYIEGGKYRPKTKRLQFSPKAAKFSR